ncbi:DNA helicase RecQ [Bombella sp. TMW 2.2559]|uniref:DNA helicase RecQ n=1 Tax=Bombella dulcis TaxID=2967339 RepID=A0ABT3W9H7_9PROT|nr:DNA helicase RecQ [Bombella dulcis]MCX5615747.1 DNA helicase RecQ [Bombella dulcis]
MGNPIDRFPRYTGESPDVVLHRVFGFPAFRGLQEEAVQALMNCEDVLLLMPTGGGKSLCYQVPALCRKGVGLVVSPLIALMEDQVAGLRQLGVRASALHSEMDYQEQQTVQEDLTCDQLDLLYISPERLLTPFSLSLLRRCSLSLIAIDEAHCVSAWGHDFRPEYRELANLKEFFPQVPRIALTATADQRTRDDILSALNMPQARILMASFHRPNLFLQAQPKLSEIRQVVDALSRHMGQGAAIIYCGSRKKTETMARQLREKGYTAFPFHAGMSPADKKSVLLRFRSGEPMVVAATIAFGMGIDRPDVRAVIHLDMPTSPEGYYQQIGRAGRDGDLSHTVLLYSGEGVARARYWLEEAQVPESEKRAMQGRLESMISLTETTGCRTQAVLACFGETLHAPCGHCDNCLHPPSTFDASEAAQKVLSTIYRTGERFGAVQLIAVLKGKMTEAVERHALHHLSVFGIGKDKTDVWWRMVIRQLIARGAIGMVGDHGGLGLRRETARPILRGDMMVSLREDASLKHLAAMGDGNSEDELSEEENHYFLELKMWRREEAYQQGIPPYIIFRDVTLREIIRARPTSQQELGEVRGVGQSKVDRYGDAVLAILRELS